MKFKITRDCDRGFCHRGCGRQDKQLNAYDWLADVPGNEESTDLVEVQFKNTRKGYYHNVNNIDLKKGDIVAVEASPGHDIGVVTMTGRLVKLQIKKANLKSADDIKRVYRIAKPVDMEKYHEAKSREHDTMIQSRQIAKELGLQMKIGDVEYQGDGNKAIFYYIADERVDFRQLIKVLAETFHIRVEMKQIGARQEAGRIGGIGPCGRELCCSTWMSSFNSVSTVAARLQDISLNPQKLAGQCAKLKCCINFEVDSYVEALKRLPSKEITLETKDNTYYHFKTDVFKAEITYSTDKSIAANLITIPASRVFEVLHLNKKGIKPLSLESDEKPQTNKRDAQDILGQESVTRFDSEGGKKKKKKRKSDKNNGGGGNNPSNGAKRPEKAEAANNSPKAADNGTDANEKDENPNPNKPNRRNNNRRPKNGNREGGNKEGNNREGNNREEGNNNPNSENRRNRERNRGNGNRPKQQPKPAQPAQPVQPSQPKANEAKDAKDTKE